MLFITTKSERQVSNLITYLNYTCAAVSLLISLAVLFTSISILKVRMRKFPRTLVNAVYYLLTANVVLYYIVALLHTLISTSDGLYLIIRLCVIGASFLMLFGTSLYMVKRNNQHEKILKSGLVVL